MAATSCNVARFTPDGPRLPKFTHRRSSYDVVNLTPVWPWLYMPFSLQHNWVWPICQCKKITIFTLSNVFHLALSNVFYFVWTCTHAQWSVNAITSHSRFNKTNNNGGSPIIKDDIVYKCCDRPFIVDTSKRPTDTACLVSLTLVSQPFGSFTWVSVYWGLRWSKARIWPAAMRLDWKNGQPFWEQERLKGRMITWSQWRWHGSPRRNTESHYATGHGR